MNRVVFCITAYLLSATLARAVLLLDDPFNYSNGPLVTVSGNVWVHLLGGSVTGEVTVESGRALPSETNTEDVSALLAGQPYPSSGATNVSHESFTVKFTVLPGGGGAYFAHFKDASTGFRARVWALTGGAAPNKFRLGDFFHQRFGHQRHEPRGPEP